MGQHCPNLCDSVTSTHHDTLLPRIKRANGVIVVICGLCNEDISENKLEYHLDYCHFAVVLCIEDQFYVECQLCGYVTLEVKAFAQHLRVRHGYMLRQAWENLSVYKQSLSSAGQISHRQLKNIPQALPSKDYKSLDGYSFHDDQFMAEYQGNLYKVSQYSKQYNSIEYNIDRVKGDLLWRYWFIEARLGRELVWYHLLSQPTQKGIKSCIFLFFKQ